MFSRAFFFFDSFPQVIEHHVSGANPGMVGLAISYALGITGKLSGLVTTFTGSFHTDQQQKERKESSTDANTETERELVAVERVQQYVNRIQPEQVREVGNGSGVMTCQGFTNLL